MRNWGRGEDIIHFRRLRDGCSYLHGPVITRGARVLETQGTTATITILVEARKEPFAVSARSLEITLFLLFLLLCCERRLLTHTGSMAAETSMQVAKNGGTRLLSAPAARTPGPLALSDAGADVSPASSGERGIRGARPFLRLLLMPLLNVRFL